MEEPWQSETEWQEWPETELSAYYSQTPLYQAPLTEGTQQERETDSRKLAALLLCLLGLLLLLVALLIYLSVAAIRGAGDLASTEDIEYEESSGEVVTASPADTSTAGSQTLAPLSTWTTLPRTGTTVTPTTGFTSVRSATPVTTTRTVQTRTSTTSTSATTVATTKTTTAATSSTTSTTSSTTPSTTTSTTPSTTTSSTTSTTSFTTPSTTTSTTPSTTPSTTTSSTTSSTTSTTTSTTTTPATTTTTEGTTQYPPLPPGSLKRKRLPGEIICEVNLTSPLTVPPETPHILRPGATTTPPDEDYEIEPDLYDPREGLIRKVPLECDTLVVDSRVILTQREVAYDPSTDLYRLKPRFHEERFYGDFKGDMDTVISWGNTSVLMRFAMYARPYYGNLLFDTDRLVRSFRQFLIDWNTLDGIILEFVHDETYIDLYHCFRLWSNRLKACHPDGQSHDSAVRLFKGLRREFQTFRNAYNNHMKLYYIYNFMGTPRNHLDMLEEVASNVDFLVKSIVGASLQQVNSFTELHAHQEGGLSLDEFLADLPELESRIGRTIHEFGVAVGITTYHCTSSIFTSPDAFCEDLYDYRRGSLWCNPGSFEKPGGLRGNHTQTTKDYYLYVENSYGEEVTVCDQDLVRTWDLFFVSPSFLEAQVRQARTRIAGMGKKMVLYFRSLRRDDPDDYICHTGPFPYLREVAKAMRP